MKVKKTGLYIDSEDYPTLLDVITPVLKGNYDVELVGTKCAEENDVCELFISPMSATDVQYRNAKSLLKYSLHALKRTFKQNRKYKKNRRKCTRKLLSHLSRNSESHDNVVDLSSITHNILWNVSYSICYNDVHINKRAIESSNKEAVNIIEFVEKATETDYIEHNTKHVQTESTDTSIGYNASPSCNEISKTGLRPIFIDGSNVAYSHGKNKWFSSDGLIICIQYFKNRGHKVMASLPNFRKAYVTNKNMLQKWEKDGTLVIIPSRRINNNLVICEEDRFIIQCATSVKGIIVSLDQFRDFLGQNPMWDTTIKERLLMYTWLGDQIIFPQDPLGSDGPKLEEFLKF